MGGNYLIPANSKKSMLILGIFNYIDLIIFGVGVTITLALLFTVRSNNITLMIFIIAPALISGFLVLPVPYYHNVMSLLGNIYKFLIGRKKYLWRGWCASNGKDR